MKRLAWQVLVALDQLANALLGGWADETVSARAWRQRHKRRWAVTRRVIDAIFFFDPNHCRRAHDSEQLRRHQPPHYRTES